MVKAAEFLSVVSQSSRGARLSLAGRPWHLECCLYLNCPCATAALFVFMHLYALFTFVWETKPPSTYVAVSQPALIYSASLDQNISAEHLVFHVAICHFRNKLGCFVKHYNDFSSILDLILLNSFAAATFCFFKWLTHRWAVFLYIHSTWTCK